MTSDASVAWQLADAASPCLTGEERTMIFVQLGCGDNHLAAERILAVVVREGFPLPAGLLGCWAADNANNLVGPLRWHSGGTKTSSSDCAY